MSAAQHASSAGRSRLHPTLKRGNLLVSKANLIDRAVARTKERLDVLSEADRLVGGQN
jgi:hypothetical protein